MHWVRSLVGLMAILLLLASCGAPAAAPTATLAPASPAKASPAPAAPASTPTTTAASPAATRPDAAATVVPRARKLKVVTTVAPITNIVRNVGGDTIDLAGIVPDGADSHTFEPSPTDARLLAEADLIIINGLYLEEPTLKLAEVNKKPNTPVLLLGDNTITRDEWIFDFSFPEDEGDPNPHLWMNVAYAMKYAELTRDALGQLDPANAQTYQQNTTTYLALLTRLDQGIATAVKTVPESNLQLLTYHDSWPYFAKRYGMNVIGAIQPSDFSEPSAREVAAIIDHLRATRVPAIFGSEVFPSPVLEQIARETGVTFVDTLRDDDLPGERAAPEHTYVGMMLENMKTMIEALGGNVQALDDIDPGNVS